MNINNEHLKHYFLVCMKVNTDINHQKQIFYYLNLGIFAS